VLQEATEGATPATFLFVAAAGQAARQTTNGILYLIDGAAATFTAGKAPCEAAHCVLHLVERTAASTAALLLTFLRLLFAAFAVGRTIVVLGIA
jgi:hypothetical protein